MKTLPALLLSLFALSLPSAHAEWATSEYVPGEKDKPWVEAATSLPPYPQNENLMAFTVSSATRNRHFVDRASISVGVDQVVRYTVVIEATGGARNVSFEGMRCASGERRLYAYGHADGSWSKSRKDAWEPIQLRSLLSYQKALFEQVFCRDGLTVKDSAEAVLRLQEGA